MQECLSDEKHSVHKPTFDLAGLEAQIVPSESFERGSDLKSPFLAESTCGMTKDIWSVQRKNSMRQSKWV